MRSTQRHRHLDVWLVESSPSISHRSLSDVDRRDRVSKSTEPACSTGEPRLTRAIGLLAVPTGGTGAARVARVHEDDRDTSKARLVRDERPQLIEGPGVQCCPVAAPNGYPLPNPLEVFQRDSATCALSLGNDLLADDVNYPRLKPEACASPVTWAGGHERPIDDGPPATHVARLARSFLAMLIAPLRSALV